MLTPIFPRINDTHTAIEQDRNELLAISEHIKDLELYETKLKIDFEKQTSKWHSRWPEQEDCCMMLKWELSIAQARLNETYQQIQDKFAGVEHPKAAGSLVEVAPCATSPSTSQYRVGVPKKDGERAEAAKEISGDLIVFDNNFPGEDGAIRDIAEETRAADLVDLITECPEENSSTNGVPMERIISGDLVDLDAGVLAGHRGASSKCSKMAPTSDDLAVLITDFPVPRGEKGSSECQIETHTIDDIVELLSGLLSKKFVRLIGEKFESSKKNLQEKESAVKALTEEVRFMQPLYDIGLAIRKRKVELDCGKRRDAKDRSILSEGNEAAHHAQALADATWLDEQRFKEMYNGVAAKFIWKHREYTKLQEILNWRLDMRQFNVAGGIDKTTFDKNFNLIFRRIYPSLKVSDEEFNEHKDLREAHACMRSEYDDAYERSAQQRARNRIWLMGNRLRRGMADAKC